MLREVFELLLDSSQKKSYLVTRLILNDTQKLQIRRSVLIACALCGPDSIDEKLYTKESGAAAKKYKFNEFGHLVEPDQV